MPTNQTLASDNDQLVLHFRESNPQSQAILDEQRPRLVRNARVVLWCLLEGQRLSGWLMMQGIKHAGMEQPKRMTEYRRRIGNIKELDILVEERILPDGCKEWWINPELIETYKEKFNHIPRQ